MKTLTIFTPAYNRAHTIGRTYESLCRQTCKDFEWLIVDDGSTDNTRQLVEEWIAENKIPIRYIFQENQGMHGQMMPSRRLLVSGKRREMTLMQVLLAWIMLMVQG